MNPYFISYLPIAVLSTSYFSYVYTQRGKIPFRLFFLISTVFFLTCASGEWIKSGLGQDDYQWYFVGKNLFENFLNWYHHFAIFDHTRILSILPVGFLWWLGIKTPHTIFTILVVITFITILWFCIQWTKDLIKAESAQLSIALFLIIYASFGEIHFWSYNSEHLVVILFCLSLIFIRNGLRDDNKHLSFFLAGLLLTATVFAKEQFSISAISVYLTLSTFLIFQNKIRQWLALTSGCLLTSIFIWFLCVYPFSFNALKAYYSIGIEYQNRSFADQTPIAMNYFFIKQFLQITFLNPHYFILIASFFYFIYSQSQKYFKQKTDFKILTMSCIVIVYFITTLVSIMISKKNISHYTILLIPGFIVFFTHFIDKLNRFRKNISIVILCYIILAPVATRSNQTIYPVHGYEAVKNKLERDSTLTLIKKYISPGKKVMLWGYANQYMVELHAQRSSGYLTSQFAFPPIQASEFVRGQFLHDLEIQKPDYVLELVGPNQFFTTNKSKHSISSAHPEMFKLLNLNYQVILDSAEVKIYQKID
jgi:hypothetical protein